MLAAATFALSKLIVHEKVESWLRAAVRGRERRPAASEGPPPALRRRRAAHLHPLHRRLDRPRARRPAAARARRPGARSRPSSPPRPATTCCRPASVAVCGRQHARAEARRSAPGRAPPVSQPDGAPSASRRPILEQLGRAREVQQPPHRRRHAREHEPHVTRARARRAPAAAPSSTAESMNVTSARSSTRPRWPAPPRPRSSGCAVLRRGRARPAAREHRHAFARLPLGDRVRGRRSTPRASMLRLVARRGVHSPSLLAIDSSCSRPARSEVHSGPARRRCYRVPPSG